MMVPRSFKYGAVAASGSHGIDEKDGRRNSYNSITSSRVPVNARAKATPLTSIERPPTQPRAVTAPTMAPSKPVDVPDRRRSAMSQRGTASRDARKSSASHRNDALSPSVAALLAMTTIPPPRPHQARRRRTTGTPQISIDELVSSWKNDDTLRSSMPSSPSMSVLLESADETEQEEAEDGNEGLLSRTRSTSTDSVPSLDADEQSLLSVYSPSTPASLRSRRSISNLKREKIRSSSLVEDCLHDHPLSLTLPAEEIIEPSSFVQTRNPPPKARSSLRSNLTTSLQALKNAAISSISSLTNSSTAPAVFGRSGTNNSHLSDDVLWSHPFLFPRLSSEVRPAISGTPTKAQRRYLNPMPLTFEEQEEPFQRALHAPFLAEKIAETPVIQLQTYARPRRRSSRRAASPDPASEAGRAQLLSCGIRQREPRENGDFLRIVVLEMNMRRVGKLEAGRAKIWLPPRQVSDREVARSKDGKVPARWVGICAY